MTEFDDHTVASAPFPQWVKQLESESTAPAHRIIHGSSWDASGQTLTVSRIGIRAGEGYYYCGSIVNDLYDWVRDFSAYALVNAEWVPVLEKQDIPEPDDAGVVWFDLPTPTVTAAFVVHVRRGGIAGWWTPWNLAKNGIVLDAKVSAETQVLRQDTVLVNAPIDEALTWHIGQMTASFSLRRPSMTHLSFDSIRAAPGLLRLGSLEFLLHEHVSQFANGVAMRAVGRPQLLGGLRRDQGAVTISTDDSSVTYESAADGIRLVSRWSRLADGIRLDSTLDLAEETLFWNADVWSFCLDPRVTPVIVYGEGIEEGTAGVTRLPVQLDFPGFGELRIESADGDLRMYNEVARHAYATNHAIQLAAIDDPVAGVRIPAGRHTASFNVTVAPRRRFIATRPRGRSEDSVNMVEIAISSALAYRQDTATLTNNGSSQQAFVCFETWANLVEQITGLLPDRDVYGMLRHTVERWLDHAPGYASGTVEMEESYLMTRSGGLAGVARYLHGTSDKAWFESRAEQIWDAIEFTRALDSDGDGLIESPHRLGIRGQGQWSSNWWDAISFGHKDAFSNAQLYPALLHLSEWYRSQGHNDQADSLAEWAAALKASFVPTFFNPKTGWLGGWRSADDELHDYAFLFVNGAAVVCGLLDTELAADIVDRLSKEMAKVGFTHFEFGLPGNLHSIDDDDMPELVRNLPFETYLNGGATMSQARWFLEALYVVGRTDEADAMLAKFASAFINSTAFGGVESGIDWRRWDGSPSGYEGILADQFGILATAVREFGIEIA